MEKLTLTDKLAYSFVAFIFVFALYFGFTDEEYFNNVFVVEDGFIEYGTAFMLLLISLLCLYRLFTISSNKSVLWKLGTFIFALLFFFGAGEEISWGQRIFNIESNEFFKDNNSQAETNLHNLVVDGKRINKIVFSQMLMVVMVLYLIVAPVLYRKAVWFKKLVDQFGVPIVKWHHTIVFIIATILVTIIPADKKWEVYEFVFGVLFLLIFLNPLNQFLFKRKEI